MPTTLSPEKLAEFCRVVQVAGRRTRDVEWGLRLASDDTIAQRFASRNSIPEWFDKEREPALSKVAADFEDFFAAGSGRLRFLKDALASAPRPRPRPSNNP
jgi:hypothetical protein